MPSTMMPTPMTGFGLATVALNATGTWYPRGVTTIFSPYENDQSRLRPKYMLPSSSAKRTPVHMSPAPYQHQRSSWELCGLAGRCRRCCSPVGMPCHPLCYLSPLSIAACDWETRTIRARVYLPFSLISSGNRRFDVPNCFELRLRKQQRILSILLDYGRWARTYFR